jgi:hypothetical protein
MPIRSFRGKLADGAEQSIALHTNNGSTGYRIVKFQIMPDDPNQTTVKHVVKIFTISQATIDDSIDFSDNTLLGAATYNEAPGPQDQSAYDSVIFDNMTFNQDIFVTNSEPGNNQPVNYYIELEMVRLDLNENTVATLKDIRNITEPSPT